MHTKGPWKVDTPDMHPDGKTVLGFYVAHEDGGRICKTFVNCLVTSDEESSANARLIAAAPDLLALCVEMHNWLRPEVVKEPDRSFFWKLQALIDKALNN